MTIQYPTQLDTDTELYRPVDGETDVIAAHHNALADAIKAIEEKLGIDGSAIVNTIDYILTNMVIKSDPPSGKRRVYRIWRNEDGIIEYEYETEPIP